jgi:geranylgeranyl diphosphate synthase type II
MTDPSPRLQRLRAEIQSTLAEDLPPEDTRPIVLHQAMRYSVLAGGKRLRPLLALAVVDALGGDPAAARRSAAALELFHTYTLIHDDLPCMDDDDLRRGLPTCHVKFGEANALLAGDALLTLAFAWLAEGPAGADGVRELAQAGGSQGVVGGQVEDLAAEGRAADAETLAWIHRHKTAALIRAALRLGGRLAGLAEPVIDRLGRIGDLAGLAFQIVDDLLDETSTDAELGKPVGSDRANAKMTYVTLHGLEGARREANHLAAEARAELADLPTGDWSVLEELLRGMVERRS